jgi:hypothetical protein
MPSASLIITKLCLCGSAVSAGVGAGLGAFVAVGAVVGAYVGAGVGGNVVARGVGQLNPTGVGDALEFDIKYPHSTP